MFLVIYYYSLLPPAAWQHEMTTPDTLPADAHGNACPPAWVQRLEERLEERLDVLKQDVSVLQTNLRYVDGVLATVVSQPCLRPTSPRNCLLSSCRRTASNIDHAFPGVGRMARQHADDRALAERLNVLEIHVDQQLGIVQRRLTALELNVRR